MARIYSPKHGSNGCLSVIAGIAAIVGMIVVAILI